MAPAFLSWHVFNKAFEKEKATKICEVKPYSSSCCELLLLQVFLPFSSLLC